MISVLPPTGFTMYKVATKFSKFASAHSTLGFTDDELLENIFECLPFLE